MRMSGQRFRPGKMLASAVGGHVAGILALLLLAADAGAQEAPRLVGSGTTMEIVDLVVDRAAKASGGSRARVERMPGVEAVKLFCAGDGPEHPVGLGLVRPLTELERRECAVNGVTEPVEYGLLMEATVLVAAAEAPISGLTSAQLARLVPKEVPVGGALAPNPVARWRDLDKGLPDLPVSLILPPPQSGTWLFLLDRLLEPACKAQPVVAALPAEAQVMACRTPRADAVVPTDPAANATVRSIASRPGAMGVIGFPFFVVNGQGLKVLAIDGVTPSRASIADGTYPLSRVLRLYVKRGAVDPVTASLRAELTPGRALGPGGYLDTMGPLPAPTAAGAARK